MVMRSPSCGARWRLMEKVLGPEHPNVALYLCNLGELLKSQGDYTDGDAGAARAGD